VSQWKVTPAGSAGATDTLSSREDNNEDESWPWSEGIRATTRSEKQKTTLLEIIISKAIFYLRSLTFSWEPDFGLVFPRFFGIAKASAVELRAQFYIALAEGYVTKTEFKDVCSECFSVARQCSKFAAYLKE
jgi:hypothetical protein